MILIFLFAVKYHDDEKMKHSDSIMIFILTQQISDGKLLAFDREYSVFEVLDKFRAIEMPVLANKPKLVFIETKWTKGSVLNLLTVQEYTRRIEMDFFIEVGHRTHHVTGGSILIQALVDILKTCDLHQNDLMRIMNITLKKMTEKPSSLKKDIPLVVTTLSKSYYFLNPQEMIVNTMENNDSLWCCLKSWWFGGGGGKYSSVISVHQIKQMLYWFGPLISAVIIYRVFKKTKK